MSATHETTPLDAAQRIQVADSVQVAAHEPEASAVARLRPEPCTAYRFFKAIDASAEDAGHVVVLASASGAPNDHRQCPASGSWAVFAEGATRERSPGYFTGAAFRNGTVGRFRGRTAVNIAGSRAFVFDIEGVAGKAGVGYDGSKVALRAVSNFVAASGLTPNFLVLTGGAGLHVWFVLNETLAPTAWVLRARALAALADLHGLHTDRQCTTDIARIMRAPGSIHNKTGKSSQAFAWRAKPYSLSELDAVVGVDVSAGTGPLSGRIFNTSINKADVLDVAFRPRSSYLKAAEKCGAMRKAASRRGEATTYPVWALMLITAKNSKEGDAFGHDASSGHPEYNEAATDKKILSLTGGPAGCEAWASAYGIDGPCSTCEWRGTVKSPLIQLGASVDTSLPAAIEQIVSDPAAIAVTDAAPSEGQAAVPEHVSAMNERFGLVRLGGKVVVADEQTPTTTARGTVRGLGFLDIAGFRTMLRGRWVPPQKPGDKPRPLADSWLEDTRRRQYEGVTFAPPPAKPPGAGLLNLWRGFALDPAAGEIQLWLDVLAALVPQQEERTYVLHWLAWKIQNPGGVPDTVLIFVGGKGTGKNSLFDPVLALFGQHGMLADDPELIAGRFTGHLMTLAFAVLDEAVFAGDPRQSDRIKSRVTAKLMTYEQKGVDPVSGVNRCAYVMLTNHEHAWQATTDERRAVVLEVGDGLRGELAFWKKYHAWVEGPGTAALLHYLTEVDVRAFNPRAIPKGEALRRQVELTALRDPVAAWWHQCLSEGSLRWRDGGLERVVTLDDAGLTHVDSAFLRQSYEQSAAVRRHNVTPWPVAAKKLSLWCGSNGLNKIRPRTDGARVWRYELAPLHALRLTFESATHIGIDE